MGLGGFFKKLFGKGDQVAPAAQAAPEGVPGAVDMVGTGVPAPTPATPAAPVATPPPATAQKTA